MIGKLSATVTAILIAFCSLMPAQADDAVESESSSAYSPWPKWYISIGATHLDVDGRYGVGIPDVGFIPIIDFALIGIPETDDSPYFSLSWRSSESRWGAWLSYWRFETAGTREWSDNWPIDPETTIPVGAMVTADFDASFYIAEVTYSFFRNERVDAGMGFGFHVVDLDTNVLATVNVGEFETELIRANLDTLAPLPNVTGYAAWRFAPRWTLNGRFGWFGLSVDKYSGDMFNVNAMLDFHLSDRWTLGGGYHFVSFDVDIDEVEDEGYTENYDLDFDGPVLYLSLTF